MSDKTELGYNVDTSALVKAKEALDQATASANRVRSTFPHNRKARRRMARASRQANR